MNLFHLDIDECTENDAICELGTCSNNDDGTFYECSCQDGAMTAGSEDNLTCIGQYILVSITILFKTHVYPFRY